MFFRYGTDVGDQQLPQYDGAMESRIDLDPPLRFFGKLRDYVSVHDDGRIGTMHGSIYIFNEDVDLSRNGQVFWRKSNSTADLRKVRYEIESAFPAYESIDLKWAVMVTWEGVVPSNISYSVTKSNTFHAILTTDGNRSFVLIFYTKISWQNDENTLAGFVLHEPFSEELEYLISGSKSPEMLTIGSRSNVGNPSKWIFRIDQPTIYEPNSVCGFPPIENYGWCKAEEFVPDTLAHCRCLFTKENTTLKCSRSADNKTVAWIGNLPECHLPFSTTAQSPPSV